VDSLLERDGEGRLLPMVSTLVDLPATQEFAVVEYVVLKQSSKLCGFLPVFLTAYIVCPNPINPLESRIVLSSAVPSVTLMTGMGAAALE
jgi:hypothetical protein